MKHNIIAFPNAASFDFSAAGRRAEARFRAAERRRNLLSAVETVTDKMPSTVESAEITKRGVEGCIISGPLALDGAISMESVKHKAIKDPVAGQADILLVPYIEAGNMLYKAVTYIAGKTMASVVCGASCPVIITSRADTPDSKYFSILMAVLRAMKGC